MIVKVIGMSRSNADFYKQKSDSDPAKYYTVVHLPDGSWKCSCADYAFRRLDCKHIIRQKELLKNKLPLSKKVATSNWDSRKEEIFKRLKEMGEEAAQRKSRNKK